MIYLIILIIISINNYMYTSESLKDIIGNINDIYSYLPEKIYAEGESYSYYGKWGGNFKADIKVDKVNKRINIFFDADHFKVNSTLDENLITLESKTTFLVTNKEIYDFLGNDRTDCKQNTSNSQLIYTYYISNQIKQVKTIPYDKNTIDSDAANFMLQIITHLGKKNFNADFILKALGMKMNMDIDRFETDNILNFTPNYKFPQNFHKITNNYTQFYVYQIKISGIFGMIFRTKYYLAFSKTPPYDFVAYWGGEGKYTEFLFLYKFKNNN